MAVLSFMVSLVLELNLRIAAGLWASKAITSFLGISGSTGLTSQAMLQGGIGLLLTVLLVTAPAAAAQFFGGTLGQFYHQSVLGGGGSGQSAVAPGGGAPGTYAPAASQTSQTTSNQTGSTGGLGGNPGSAAARNASSTPHVADSIDSSRTTTPPARALNVDGA